MGQSSSTAASIAIDLNCDVQQVPYDKLKAKLLEDNQVLDFESPAAKAAQSIPKEKLEGLVVDDSEATKEGFEDISQVIGPFVMKGYAHDGNKDKGKQKMEFRPKIAKGGNYELFVLFTRNDNRATNIPITIKHRDGQSKVTLNNASNRNSTVFASQLAFFLSPRRKKA